MLKEQRLFLAIFLVLVALITLPLALHHIKDSRRPLPAEVRVVTATASDPVYRDGRRRVQAGDPVSVALAVKISQLGRDDRWLAPVERLSIGGSPVDHLRSDSWIEDDRTLRVFWFSVECANLGGRVTPQTAGNRLRYRTFLAPEMGRGLRAAGLPEPHNDDHLGTPETLSFGAVGTFRLYARLEIAESLEDPRPVHSVASAGVDKLGTPDLAAVWRSGSFAPGIREEVGELFRLPGFEPEDEPPGSWRSVTKEAFNRPFTALVEDRLVVSSWTFAATAAAGTAELDRGGLEHIATVPDVRSPDGGQGLRWMLDVMPGDLASSGGRWMVLLSDEGNGVLDPADAVLATWGRPPQRTTVFAALDPEAESLDVYRHAG